MVERVYRDAASCTILLAANSRYIEIIAFFGFVCEKEEGIIVVIAACPGHPVPAHRPVLQIADWPMHSLELCDSKATLGQIPHSDPHNALFLAANIVRNWCELVG